MEGLPLTPKFAHGHEAVIQGQGHFTKCGVPQEIPAVV